MSCFGVGGGILPQSGAFRAFSNSPSLNDLATAEAIIAEHRDELAAVIVEPMQRTFVPAAGFLEGLRRITPDLSLLNISQPTGPVQISYALLLLEKKNTTA